MTEALTKPPGQPVSRTAGWSVLLMAWIAFAAAFFAFSKTVVEPAPDITDARLLEYGRTFGPFIGVAFGLLSFLASGIIYLIVRLIRKRPSRAVAFVLTALGYAPWLWLGYDLAYLEPRNVEVANAIITYAGKPTLFSSVLVCGGAPLGAVLSLVLKKRP